MANIMMEIGKSALHASQAAIQTTGNNIANVNTPGYTRQYVRLEEQVALDFRPGRQGLGVNATEVVRYFDAFLEKSYVDKHSTFARWDKDYALMRSVENIFNESNRAGVSSQMSAFFSAWQDISLRPDDMPTREAMLAQSDSLTQLIRSTEESIRFIQGEMNMSIQVDVDRANVLIRSIYDMNVQIKQHLLKGVNNPNDLMDKRDQFVRELSEIIDVEIYQRDDFYQIRLKSGSLLVDDVKGHFELEVRGPKSETHLAQLQGAPAGLSNYAGNVTFMGDDSYEYTLEITRGGDADGPLAVPPTDSPQFRVSLDGGKTWLKDDDGRDLLFDIPPNYIDPNSGLVTTSTQPIQAKNLQISFEDLTGGNSNFNVGDKFSIVPKSGLYFVAPTKGSVEGLPWYGGEPYTGPLNITPQAYFDGTENGTRAVGGSLAAYFNIRDNICGTYLDRLD
ncbi:MAG: flagellar hook-associated protein FlgK, partial [Deltaproteobacteria bacterium]|nr:flagellar hook-associated protein FlgK [Deltaproteobacteria bacterium]